MDNNQNHKGIRIRTLNTIMIAAAVVIVAVLVGLILRMQDRYQNLHDNTDVYIKCLSAAPDLSKGSDYLTEQVRSFVVTGDKTYLDNYFTEANVTRRRDKALEVLNPYMEGTAALNYLNLAMSNSLELMNVEYYAMRLEWESESLPNDLLPEELRNITLSKRDGLLSAAEKHESAISMVFDQTYQLYKDRIISNVDSCIEELMEKMETEQQDSHSAMTKIMFTLFGMIIFLLLLVIAAVVLTFSLVMQPMTKAVNYIRDNKMIPVGGAAEVQFLVEAYNHAVEKTQRQHADLQQQALHDALTGLLNRAGYEKVIAELEEEKLCLLLIDIDKFKTINDTYGHDVGDLVLKKTSDVLRHQFRSADMIFRFGGDEYAVIMMNAGPDLEDLIKIKIGNANKQLAADEKLPEASLSVGASFGTGTVTEELFKSADNALYQVKNRGGCGVSFGN